MTTKPSRKRLKFVDKTTVLIEVGKEKARFYVHASFLCDASTFFKAALDDDFKEAEIQQISLPEGDPDIFELFLEWLYSQEYKGMAGEATKKSDLAGLEMQRFIDLYVLADKIGVQGLKRSMLQRYFEICQLTSRPTLPIVSMLSGMYKRTTPNCTLRKLLIASHVWSKDYRPAEITAGFPEYRIAATECPEMLADFTCELMAKTFGKKKNPFNGAVEHFYEPAMLEKKPLRPLQPLLGVC